MVSNIVNDKIVFIWLMGGTVTDTTPQGGPGSNGNVGILFIPRSSRTDGSLWNGLVSCQDTRRNRAPYQSAETQSTYSKALVDWAIHTRTNVIISKTRRLPTFLSALILIMSAIFDSIWCCDQLCQGSSSDLKLTQRGWRDNSWIKDNSTTDWRYTGLESWSTIITFD